MSRSTYSPPSILCGMAALLFWVGGLSVSAAPWHEVTLDLDQITQDQGLTFLQATDPTVRFAFRAGGRPYRALSGYTMKFYYGSSLTAGSFVTVSSTTMDTSAGVCTMAFDATETNTNGTFVATAILQDASTNLVWSGQIDLVIRQTTITSGAGNLILNDITTLTTNLNLGGFAISNGTANNITIDSTVTGDGSGFTNITAAAATNVLFSNAGVTSGQLVRATGTGLEMASTTLTDADVPDTITASSYLPLAGGTMTGPATGTLVTVAGLYGTNGITLDFNADGGDWDGGELDMNGNDIDGVADFQVLELSPNIGSTNINLLANVTVGVDGNLDIGTSLKRLRNVFSDNFTGAGSGLTGVTDAAALPKAGGTMTGPIIPFASILQDSGTDSIMTYSGVAAASTLEVIVGDAGEAAGGTRISINDSTQVVSVPVGSLTVPTEVYGAGWNGDLSVPTKDAVYDKVETLGAGGGIVNTVLTTAASSTWDSGTGTLTVDTNDNSGGSAMTIASQFRAHQTADQAVSQSTWSTLTMDAEDRDVDATFTPATGVWIPAVGESSLAVCVQASSMPDAGSLSLRLVKNGTSFLRGFNTMIGGATTPIVTASWPFYNSVATNQYTVEIYNTDSTSPSTFGSGGNDRVWISGRVFVEP